MISKKQIGIIKRWLPEGYIAKIVERSGFSQSMVEKFFSGDRYNITIHQEAVKLAEETKEEIEQLKERAESL